MENGKLFLSTEEKASLIAEYPNMTPFVRLASGSEEYINGVERWCLWLVGASPSLIRQCPPVAERVRAVREFRLASSKDYTRRSANRPTLFQQIRQPDAPFIIIPRVSSENRRYIPMGFLQPDVVPLDSAQFIPNATLYDFGVLTSSVHMAWVRATAGRLELRYRYSAKLCYNSFVWPFQMENGEWRMENEAADSASPRLCVEKISAAAQLILDARAAHSDCTLADLYDDAFMPADLRAAHEANDRAVLAAYGLAPSTPEPKIVAHLFKLYAEKASQRQ